MRGVKLASDTADTLAAVLRRATPNEVVREARIVLLKECSCSLRASRFWMSVFARRLSLSIARGCKEARMPRSGQAVLDALRRSVFERPYDVIVVRLETPRVCGAQLAVAHTIQCVDPPSCALPLTTPSSDGTSDDDAPNRSVRNEDDNFYDL